MKRDLEKTLKEWKNSQSRIPLLLRGARQVGKTTLIEQFGKAEFESFVTINFELDRRYINAFETLNPTDIIFLLEVLSSTSIISGKTLLFLDEIQECPRAIMALRYFKEQMPDLHVIGAGSLLEFALHDESFRMPVGRIQYLYLGPLSFGEFLDATGHKLLRKTLEKVTLKSPMPLAIHEQALELTCKYAALGGMPSVIQQYVHGGKPADFRRIQLGLLATYRDDFGKYAKQMQHKTLALLFERAPYFISQWLKFSKVDPDLQPRAIRSALENLTRAGLIYPVYATSAAGLPLIATANFKKFKLLFLDIGLAQTAMGLDFKHTINKELLLINRGSIAEQFTSQELLAARNPYEPPALFFWVREKTGSSAEVDYLTVIRNHVVPIEVKAGSTGRLRSLHLFMNKRNVPRGVRTSSAPLSVEGKVLTLPYYLVSELNRLYEEME